MAQATEFFSAQPNSLNIDFAGGQPAKLTHIRQGETTSGGGASRIQREDSVCRERNSTGKEILENALFPRLAPTDAHAIGSTRYGAFLFQVLAGAGTRLSCSADLREIRLKLFLSKEWRLVYKGTASLAAFSPQPGDVVIWDRNITMRNVLSGKDMPINFGACGVLDGRGKIVHPDSSARFGSARSDFARICAIPSYGNPTAIYRVSGAERGE
jgi:hypothetical protein